MVKLTNAIQSGGQYENLTSTFTPIPGLDIIIRAGTAVYIDLRMFINANAAVGFKIRIDGWTPNITYPMPIFDLQNFLDQQQYLNASRPDPMQWNPFTGISYYGELHAFGTIANDLTIDQHITVSLACATVNPPTTLVAIGARMSILEDSEVNQIQSRHNFSSMNPCGCCYDAQLSCCQDQIVINTANPDTDFDWKIVDSLGNVYTGTMTTDADGVGSIEIGDGLDLPDAFLDAPGVSFKLEFTSMIPSIAMKVACIDVETISGAYLAIAEIGEPLV